jgi:2-methylcitrate dehydratase PrpD
MAAAQAVRAVALAREGITGPSSVFDGRFGWFRTHLQAVAPADFRFSRATESLGHEWEMLNVASKPYPSAFTIHPYVDAVLALKSALDIDVSRIAEIRCEIAQSSVATLCEPVAEKLRPLTPWHGRISLQHSLAEAFIIGKMDKNSYGWDALKDPRIQALADKVTYRVDPVRHLNAKKSGAHVTIFLNDGSNMCHVIDSVRGTRDNPISEEDYFRKFRSNADGVLSPSLIEKTIDSMMTLEGHDDIAPIFDRLSAPDDIRT